MRLGLRLLVLVWLSAVLFASTATKVVYIKHMSSIEPISGADKPCGSSKLMTILCKAKTAALKGGLYGAAAGGIQVLVLMWLRTIVNYQYRFGVTFQEAAKQLYAAGGVLRFYRGLPYALLQNPLSKFGAVAAYEGSRAVFGDRLVSATALSVLLSMLWKVFIMPLETIKTILQVNGSEGLQRLIVRLRQGEISALFAGSTATILSTFFSHYPWYLVHNTLDQMLRMPEDLESMVWRSAFIGLIATAVSDVVSNALRVIKTLKQARIVDEEVSYESVIRDVCSKGGWMALVGRGLATRVAANAIQGVLFTIVWKLLPLYVERYRQRRGQRAKK